MRSSGLNAEVKQMLAASYPFLDVLWSMVIFFMFFIWIMILFKVFGDLFRRRDIGGGMKTVWIIFVILLPFLGVFVYLIAEGHKMAERDILVMGRVCREYLLSQRAKATPELQREIDRVWQRILDEDR